jgi:hypothetical protein
LNDHRLFKTVSLIRRKNSRDTKSRKIPGTL